VEKPAELGKSKERMLLLEKNIRRKPSIIALMRPVSFATSHNLAAAVR
jgi:hypothetical protein